MPNTIKNNFVSVSFFEKTEYNKAYIIFRDLTDHYNEPTGYTRKISGTMPIAKAWEFIGVLFSKDDLKDDLNFNDILKILDEKFNLNVHTYCAID